MSTDTIALEDLSQLDDNANAMLKEIIIDEWLLNDMIEDKQLKYKGRKSTAHHYGKFYQVRVKSGLKPLMLYSSEYHGSSSGIHFFDYISNIKYTKKDVDLQSCLHRSHPFLCPFFMANVKVNEVLGLWVQNNGESPLLKSVQKVQQVYSKDEENSVAYLYSEEDWTERLANALNIHPLFANDSPACLKSFKFSQTTELDRFRCQRFGFPPSNPKLSSHYLFHGLPDIYLISGRPQIVQCAISPADVPADVADTPQDFDSCADSIFIGEAAQGSLTLSYPYSKMGELLANMNCAHNDNILHHFLSTKDYNVQPFVINGLFLHNRTGCSNFSMELKGTKLSTGNFTCLEYHIEHGIIPSQVLDQGLLCAALRDYAGVDLHSPSCEKTPDA